MQYDSVHVTELFKYILIGVTGVYDNIFTTKSVSALTWARWSVTP